MKSHYHKLDSGSKIVSDPKSPKCLILIRGEDQARFEPHPEDESWFKTCLATGYNDEQFLITAGGADKMVKFWDLEGEPTVKHSFKGGKKLTSFSSIHTEIASKQI